MTHEEARSLLEGNVSRGAMMSGFGCVSYFVPKKQVGKFRDLVLEVIPVGIRLDIHPLNTTCKKGVFEYWSPRDGKDIPQLILNSGKEK